MAYVRAVPTGPNYASELAFALDLAEQADRISRRYFRSTDLHVDRKADASPVSEADTAIEQAIRQRVGETYPDDAVLGEEYGASQPGARRRWIVDPIDGTRKFVRGLPGFATLLALEAEGEVVVGVASAPALERRWWAARGQGAFANGTPIHVSERAVLSAAHVAHGSIEGWVQIGRLAGLAALATRSWGTSGYADFWIHMLVAEGAAEVAVEAQAAIWDVAALALIVEEAGGRFSDVDGSRTITGGSAISSNGLVHDEVVRTLRRP
jgi:histidinol-phosphatase